jgi:hypothetical protein
MDKYKDFVENAARRVTSEKQVFNNSGPIHAAIVMSRIFKHSTKEVNIFCGGFSGTISNDEEYLKHLDGFLTRGGNLRMFVQADNSKNPDAKIFKVLRKHPGKYELYKTEMNITEHNVPVHFMTGDNVFLRVETDILDYSAKVYFGDTSQTKKYNDVFEQLYNYPKDKL